MPGTVVSMNVFAYWAARTGIFIAVLIVLWSVGWRDILAVFAAFIVGWLISYLVLPKMREGAKVQMDGWVTRSHIRRHSEDAVEDAEADGASTQGAAPDSQLSLERDADGEQDPVGQAHGADAQEDERQPGRDRTDAHRDGE